MAYGRQRCRTQNTASVSLPNLSPIVKLGGIAGFHNKAAGLGRVTLGAFAGGMVSCAFVRSPLFAKRELKTAGSSGPPPSADRTTTARVAK